MQSILCKTIKADNVMAVNMHIMHVHMSSDYKFLQIKYKNAKCHLVHILNK